MSIAVITSPNVDTPAYNQMVYNVSSTNASQSNFNFLADVYVGGVLKSRLVFPKQPGSSSCLLDISPVMRNYLTYDFLNVIDDYSLVVNENTNSQAFYYVQFGEVYDVSGIPTTYADLTRNPSAGNNSVYNCVFDFEQFTPNIWPTYDVSLFGYLTTRPENIKIKEGQTVVLTYYDENNEGINIRIDAGVFIDFPVSLSNNYQSINVGVAWQLLVSESLDTAALAQGYYDIKVLGVADAVLATIRVEVDSCTSKYDNYRLHWLNQLGGWDSYNFDKVSQSGMNIERNQYKKTLPLNYDINDRLKTNYNTTIVDSIQVRSDWVSDAMAEWLQGLFQSPIVLLETSTGMIPINVTNADYQIEQYANGRRLHNISLDFQYTYNRYRQSL